MSGHQRFTVWFGHWWMYTDQASFAMFEGRPTCLLSAFRIPSCIVTSHLTDAMGNFQVWKNALMPSCKPFKGLRRCHGCHDLVNWRYWRSSEKKQLNNRDERVEASDCHSLLSIFVYRYCTSKEWLGERPMTLPHGRLSCVVRDSQDTHFVTMLARRLLLWLSTCCRYVATQRKCLYLSVRSPKYDVRYTRCTRSFPCQVQAPAKPPFQAPSLAWQERFDLAYITS